MIDKRTNELIVDQEEMDQIPPKYQGPIFAFGEYILLKGIPFTIVNIERNKITLKTIKPFSS